MGPAGTSSSGQWVTEATEAGVSLSQEAAPNRKTATSCVTSGKITAGEAAEGV